MEECYFPLYPFWYWLKFQNKNAYTQVHTNKSSRNRDSWENFQLRNPTSWRWLPETHFHSLRAVGSKPSSMVLLEILWATEHACFRNLASLKKNTHRHKYLTVYLLTLMRYNLHPIKCFKKKTNHDQDIKHFLHSDVPMQSTLTFSPLAKTILLPVTMRFV